MLKEYDSCLIILYKLHKLHFYRDYFTSSTVEQWRLQVFCMSTIANYGKKVARLNCKNMNYGVNKPLMYILYKKRHIFISIANRQTISTLVYVFPRKKIPMCFPPLSGSEKSENVWKTVLLNV